jgi:hypothetical protein
LVDGKTRLARRKKAVIPSNAKRADVNRILRTGAMHADELFELWRVARG